jgi:hypothetical protein
MDIVVKTISENQDYCNEKIFRFLHIFNELLGLNQQSHTSCDEPGATCRTRTGAIAK